MRSLSVGVGAVLIAGALVVPDAALSHDHRRPRVRLITGRERQRGRPFTWTWTKPSGDFCQITHADGIWDFPRGLDYDAGHRARIRFFKRHRPRDVKIRVYRGVDEHGGPAGKSHPVTHHLRRNKVNDRAVWDAVFRRHRIGHHYLLVEAEWRDVQGCGGPQSLTMGFHLRAR